MVKALIIVILALAGLRLVLPLAVKSYINASLSKLPDYEGSIQEVDLAVLRGGMALKDVRIYKRPQTEDAPFFSAKRLDISWKWVQLFNKSFVGKIELNQPEIHVYAHADGTKEKLSKEDLKEKAKEQSRIIKALRPFKIEEVKITDGKVHYTNVHKQPSIELHVSSIQANILNLTNNSSLGENGTASVEITGVPMENGKLVFKLMLDQFADSPKFKMENELSVALVQLNDVMRAYGGVDVAGGMFNMAMEFAADEGKFKGYVKPTFDHVDVMSWDKDKKDPIKLIKKAALGSAKELLKNQAKDRLGTKIPLSGTFDDTKIGAWEAALSLLKNGYVRALFPGVEGSIKLKDVKEVSRGG
ncbi:MAG: hypothetical protein A2901_06715 [Elusimicrobia bacterium RIFCSPLOWO2_01_FULL_54_10]|nr:MAG: hypothetical protein A2901_06715 [Elusimicrobia bacterium RIFCSPLOWO2_01_FULL_54_10]